MSGGPEQGLLGLAFDPAYINKRFFITYTDHGDSVKLAQYHVSNDPNVAVSTARSRPALGLQARTNHNGGMLDFGPDGMPIRDSATVGEPAIPTAARTGPPGSCSAR